MTLSDIEAAKALIVDLRATLAEHQAKNNPVVNLLIPQLLPPIDMLARTVADMAAEQLTESDE